VVFRCANNWKASSFTRRLESIVLYCYCLLNCSGAVHCCCSSILSEFCDRGSIGLKSVIDDRSTLRCQSTLITSKCDILASAMHLLAFLDSLGVIFVLAKIGIGWLHVPTHKYSFLSTSSSLYEGYLCFSVAHGFPKLISFTRHWELSTIAVWSHLLHESKRLRERKNDGRTRVRTCGTV
jgi:hypothetical protein